MGSATVKSLHSLRERIAGDASLSTQQAALEILECGAIVAASRQLHTTLGDPAIDADRRAQLARELFGPQVSDAVAGLLADAVAAEWSTPADLGAALQELGMLGLAQAAEIAGNRDRLLDELFAVQRVFETSPELQLGLIGRRPDSSEAAALAHDLFGGVVLPETERLVAYSVRSARGAGIARLLGRFAAVTAEAAGRQVAQVTTARPLDERQRDELTALLRSRQGGPVALDERVDPQLVGGMRIQIGPELIDATIASRLEGMRHALVRT